MEGNSFGIDYIPNTYSPITFKKCISELKRQGLERLLSAVYQDDMTIERLLLDGGASQAVLQVLETRNLGAVAEQLIEQVRRLIGQADGGERRYQIIERYYGLDGNMPARLSAMATKYGVSRERIRQIKERCLVSLRYKKRELEYMLLSMCLRSANQRPYAMTGPVARVVSEKQTFKLLNHRELLMFHKDSLPWTDEQARALSAIESANRAMITGCAGSGKTWLAVHTARELAVQGQRTVLTCFNRALADHLSDLLSRQENLVVTSFHALCLRMGRLAGVTIPGGWNSRAWHDKFPQVLRNAMTANQSLKFDAIIVDDAQDFRENWWQALEVSLADSEHSRLYLFQDDNRLRYAGQNYLPKMEASARLSINVRTPALVSPFLQSSYDGPGAMRFMRGGGSPLEFYRCESSEEVQQTLQYVVAQLLATGDYLASDLAVLSPRLPQFSSALKARLHGKARIVRRPSSNMTNHTPLSRCHSFLGLEARIAILVDLDQKFASMSDSEIRSFIYMTFSRFVDKLIVLGSADSWRLIEEVVNSDCAARMANEVGIVCEAFDETVLS